MLVNKHGLVLNSSIFTILRHKCFPGMLPKLLHRFRVTFKSELSTSSDYIIFTVPAYIM